MADVSDGQVGVVYAYGDAKESAGKAQQMNAATMLYLENDSGGTLVSGDVVVIEIDGKVNTTNSEGLKAVVVVVATNFDGTAQSIADGASGYFQVTQWCPAVKVDATAAIGDWLNTSTTVKEANQTAAASEPPTGTFGIALTAHASVVEAVLIQGMGWGSPAHVAATTNIHGIGSGVAPVGHSGTTRRIEHIEVDDIAGGAGEINVDWTWAAAFTTIEGAMVIPVINSDENPRNLSAYVKIRSTTGGTFRYYATKAATFTFDVWGIGT